MTGDAVREITRILEETDEADDALRRVVARIAAEDDVDWAAVAFLEGSTLTIGPSAGAPTERGRTKVPIRYRGDLVGELVVDGAPARIALERVADLISPLVLIGWDTGGEAWEP